MSGMLSTGVGYQEAALKGAVQVSEDEQKRQVANQQIADQEKAQNMSLMSSGASSAMMIGTMIALA